MLLTRASAVGLLALCVLVLTVKAQNLTAYNVEANNIAAVGISAGASMAIQLHVAYSASVKGAGIIAGAPYWCAMGQLAEAITSCMSIPEGIDLELLWAGTTYAYNVQGAIDDPRFLRNARVWLFSGESDTVVDRGVVKKTKMYYENYVRSDSQITFVTNISAEHAWITDNYGNGCDNLGEPFINNCNFDASGAMLRHIYPQTALKPRAAFSTSNLLAFSQANYTGGSPSSVSMGDTGFIYVPTSCQKGALCKLIVAFHGCEMDVDSIKNAYYAHSGLNQWAETNNMIVLYPQATTSTFPYNPKACWDWWGYTNSAYATQQGQQLSAIKAMINALTGKQ